MDLLNASDAKHKFDGYGHSLQSKTSLTRALPVFLALWVVGPSPAWAEIHFEDISESLGINYQRTPSPAYADVQTFRRESLSTPKTEAEIINQAVMMPRGMPATAIFDFDNDGDLDIYVTNGPGSANSLLSNRLMETGRLDFEDVGTIAGVAATDQDSSGVCYGDTDNDGDQDLYVLGDREPARLYENLGNGSFRNVSGLDFDFPSSRAEEGYASACAMGDINNDGLLDIYVAMSGGGNWQGDVTRDPHLLGQPDSLLLNTGGNLFSDVSLTSGIHKLEGEGVRDGIAMTLAVAMVDIDQDGDTDILTASDNTAVPFASAGGADIGFFRILQNDGNGFFTDVSEKVRLLVSPGDWMGISVADFNHDGTLDAFLSNTGDYFETFIGVPGADLGVQSSRHFLQQADGTWKDPSQAAPSATVFGWGTSVFDYDNDGDTDILYAGGLETGWLLERSNPGVVLRNDGAAGFEFDESALAQRSNHQRRNVIGLATGDLNQDGFTDVVSVANQDVPDDTSLTLYTSVMDITFESPFNRLASLVPFFFEAAPDQYIWTGIETDNGSLAIELSSAGNGNQSASVQLVGGVGLARDGASNRNGIGASVTFTPSGGVPALLPVMGGGGHASQNSPILTFGMGQSNSASIDVLWPGGVHNRLYDVQPWEQILFPEIPCDFTAVWPRQSDYRRCVLRALLDYRKAGVIDRNTVRRFYKSALRAYTSTRR